MSSPLIIVVGATASGKSAIGVKLAKLFNGEVVNLDSVQIFKGLDIGSGKISLSEMEGVTHHLIDIAAPTEQLNVNRIITEADKIIADISARKKAPIIVAGTTLYLKCLLNGLVEIPGEDSAYREGLARSATEDLYKKLMEVDPQRAAQISSGDRMRISRSLEIINTTGRRHSVVIEEHQHNERRYPAIILNLCWAREVLYERIDRRCAEMVQSGLLAETEAILREYGSVPSLNTLGYAQAMMVLSGELKAENLLLEMQTKTRQFAKRQLTFWRNQPEGLNWRVYPGPDDGVLLKSKDKPLKKGAKLIDSYVMERSLNELSAMLSAGFLNKGSSVELWNISAESLFHLP